MHFFGLITNFANNFKLSKPLLQVNAKAYASGHFSLLLIPLIHTKDHYCRTRRFSKRNTLFLTFSWSLHIQADNKPQKLQWNLVCIVVIYSIAEYRWAIHMRNQKYEAIAIKLSSFAVAVVSRLQLSPLGHSRWTKDLSRPVVSYYVGIQAYYEAALTMTANCVACYNVRTLKNHCMTTYQLKL